ncbi:16S/23S rRNA (cytidine-2'-O)-methyltransferase TlyA [Fundidesulfovibrio magnetotacticus]|uniref:16S/23S rRNA (Cytidine-2'-O)-methyltransferase TlyA n=1 Tax=Fundidesulfovibrio magnetotacticus TaxID=2730080 RepID=A0A6V8LQU0_9BACT|nr:TlyA family RNA methyltransferase [Fundidesulfovibrio magnetotacticus]GFK92499.1 16S/23S rRNA (cytidine-2'-O)-methyltransferase TlyA [Fundidesulfovibrio magnetotacticus]
MANPKIRADQLLVDQGLAESRERAKRLVMAGQVYLDVNGRPERLDKPGRMLPASAALSLAAPERFVSRGAYKLLSALEHFRLDVTGRTALDVGASTGGFTDCLLQHGAVKVYAVDVGKCQLHEKLRADPRVVSLEGVNFRLAAPDLIPEPVDLAVIDVSFISLAKVLPAVKGFLKPGGFIVALVKPQFELGPGQTDKGVVRDESLRRLAVQLVEGAARELGLEPAGVVPAGVKGPKGNQEYLLLLR